MHAVLAKLVHLIHGTPPQQAACGGWDLTTLCLEKALSSVNDHYSALHKKFNDFRSAQFDRAVG